MYPGFILNFPPEFSMARLRMVWKGLQLAIPQPCCGQARLPGLDGEYGSIFDIGKKKKLWFLVVGMGSGSSGRTKR